MHSFVWQPDDDDRSGETVSAENFQVVLSAWSKLDPPNYMAVNLSVSNSVFYYTSSNAVPNGVGDRLYKTEFILMRRIPAKGVTWKMGSPDSDPLREEGLETLHEVTLTDDYWMGVYEFTQAQYSHLRQGRGNAFTTYGDSVIMPVSSIAYNTIRGDLGASNWPNTGRSTVGGDLARIRKRTGVEFDLPTEAQWEFACRAGTGTQWNIPSISAGDEIAANAAMVSRACMQNNNHYCTPNVQTTAPVGLFQPNAFGLYDMHGNVVEWCLDYWQDDLGDVPVTNPVGPTSASGNYRVSRGGSYQDGAKYLRCARRRKGTEISGANAYYGFRLMAPIGLKW